MRQLVRLYLQLRFHLCNEVMARRVFFFFFFFFFFGNPLINNGDFK